MKHRLFQLFGVAFALSFSALLIVSAVVGTATYYFLKPYYLRAHAYDLKALGEFNVTSIFYDRSGKEIGRLFVEDRILLTHAEIPDLMRQATLAIEDKRFYSHKGIDYKGICRAFYYNLQNWKCAQGGSTITQQISKHLIGRFEKTFDRKLVEAFLALRIEHKHSKAEILDFYLNRIYFGKGYFGLGAAAKGYFGKPAMNLTVSECATLASIIKAPSTFSPRNDPASAIKRRNEVLSLMAAQNFLSGAATSEAIHAALHLVPEAPIRGQGYFMALAIKEIRSVLKLEEGEDIPEGLSVQTTLDSAMQRTYEAEAARTLEQTEQAAIALDQNKIAGQKKLQVAAFAIDLNNGAVRVLLGGRNYDESAFDRVRMARRENGALLQPFLYALAFERLHLHPASMINASYLDEATITAPEGAGLEDSGKDMGKQYLMIQDALASSNKSCATRVKLKLGTQNLIEWLASAGVTNASTSSQPPSLSLEPLTLYEMTSLYQMLGNGGIQIKPYCIDSVTDGRGKNVYQAKSGPGKQLLSPIVARQMTLSLRSAARDGTNGQFALDYNFPSTFAGMSGYSMGYRDAWFVGYTTSMAAGIWIGYDKSIPIGPRSLVAKSTLSFWGSAMQRIQDSTHQDIHFPVPRELIKVEVDRRTGIVQGLGFMTQGPGNSFVYLRQSQIDSLHIRDATPGSEQPKNWTDWLGTMFTNPAGDVPPATSIESDIEKIPNEIPQVVQYRMPALRGNIITADGKIFATMTQSQNLVLNWPSPDIANDDDEILLWMRERMVMARVWLKQDLDISDTDLLSLYRFQRFQPVQVAQNLTSAQSAEFRNTTLGSKGFSLQGVPRRIYPQEASLAHVLGYLQRKQGRNRKQYQAGDIIYDDYQGASGIEEIFDTELRGHEGRVTIETTPEGFTKRAVVDSNATAGSTLRLTIDSKLQEAAESAMGNIEAGAAVVMDIHNGDILAMVSRPTFDPNSFIPFLSSEKWQGFVQDVKKPLLDKVYRQQNPPGSIFKIVTAMAAMRARVFDENRTVSCPGFFQVGDMRYELPQEKSRPVAFRAAMAHSFNTYFFDLGLRAGREALVSTAQDFGIGQSMGFILPGELIGLMPDDPFVRQTHKRTMGPGDVTNASVGQGDVLVTPLQMAVLISAVANGGTLYRPRLVQRIESPTGQTTRLLAGETIRKITLPPEETKILINGLVAVTEDGTAKAARVPGIQIAAKTGTAQVGSKNQPRQIAWLVGFLPAYAPRYAFVVMIEGDRDQDLHGGEDAAPIAGKLFAKIFAN